MSDLNNHSDRAHALLSASSSHRWLACPPSAVAAEAYPEQDTEFTREGTLAHEVAEIYANGDQVDLEATDVETAEQITKEMIDCAIAYHDYIQEHKTSDDAIVLLERRVDFSPWVPDGFGTCDCIIIQNDPVFEDTKVLTIIDYKYGQGVPVSAKDNPQLKLYALGALNDYGFAFNADVVEMHIFQPRINNVSTERINVSDLIAWADNIVKPTAEKAAKGKGGYKEGSHCTFCPHAGRCRKLSSACKEFVETHDLRVAVPVLTPFELAEVLQMEPLITLWLRRIKTQALETMLNGAEVPGWKVVEDREGNRKWTDELVVLDRLDAMGIDREDITETKLLSPAKMVKAIGKTKAAEILADLVERAPGSPTIVPESDKRPAYNRADDFDTLD